MNSRVEGQAMQVAIKNSAGKRSRRTRRPQPVIPLGALSLQILEMRRLRRRSDLVFEVLLGAAACLSLVAVVNRANERDQTGTGDAPPAMFVQTDSPRTN